MFDGLSHIGNFLQEYEAKVPCAQRLSMLDMALRATPTRWWAMHKKNITTWETCHKLLMVIFGDNVGGFSYRYDGQMNPKAHIEACIQAWKEKSVEECVHLFIHTLDTSPRNWYTETKLRSGTKSWSLLTEGLLLAFGFELEYP